MKMQPDGVTFKRIDSSIADEVGGEKPEDESGADKALIEKFKNRLNDESLTIETQPLKNADVPAVILLGEQSRRMQEMYKSMGQQMAYMSDMFKDEFTLVINKNNELIKKLGTLSDEDAGLVIDHVYDLAKISHAPEASLLQASFFNSFPKIFYALLLTRPPFPPAPSGCSAPTLPSPTRR